MSKEIEDLKQRVERLERYLDTLEHRLDLDEMRLEMARTRPVSTGAAGGQGGEGPRPDLILGKLESMLRSVLLNQTGHSAELRRATRNLGILVDRGLSLPTASKLATGAYSE